MNTNLSIVDEQWVQAHPVGTRFPGRDGTEHVIESVEPVTQVVDPAVPALSVPTWVVRSHPAED
jgi:hypothetical protein